MGVRHGQPEGLDRFQKTIITATWGHNSGIDKPKGNQPIIKDSPMPARTIAVIVTLLALMTGIVQGDFFETWKNAATL